jgi:hypothetical protein
MGPVQPIVSVVIPVYNTGERIKPLVDSLLRQSLPASSYEVVFVDDGSTDGTPAFLDSLAAEHANITVLHIANSGWPGRPRNVGIDTARGTYVFFADHDDWLGTEALERLTRYAEQHHADVVVGRVVGHGRNVPTELFRRNRPRAVLGADPLLSILTPAKLFRRQFLVDRGIRFPEGRVRLEDHLFVMKAYFAASVISVLADYPCYHWVRHGAEINASSQRADAEVWADSLRAVLDVVVANVAPGPRRDRLMTHWYIGKMLRRLMDLEAAGQPADVRRSGFESMRAVAEDYFGPGVDAALPFPMRMLSALLRAGRLEDFSALARELKGWRVDCRLEDVRWVGGRLRWRYAADLVDAHGAVLVFTRRGRRLLWSAPPELAHVVGGLPDRALDAGNEARRGRFELLLAGKGSETLYLPGTFRPASFLPLRRSRIGYVGEAWLDPAAADGARPLAAGVWTVRARMSAAGLVSAGRARADLRLHGAVAPRPGLLDGRAVHVRFDDAGHVRLGVAGLGKSLSSATVPAQATVSQKAGTVEICVTVPLTCTSAGRAWLTLTGADGRTMTLRAAAQPAGDGVTGIRAAFPAPDGLPGDMHLGLTGSPRGTVAPLGVTLRPGEHHTVDVVGGTPVARVAEPATAALPFSFAVGSWSMAVDARRHTVAAVISLRRAARNAWRQTPAGKR